jgi:uncharacterized Tic20 family protein
MIANSELRDAVFVVGRYEREEGPTAAETRSYLNTALNITIIIIIIIVIVIIVIIISIIIISSAISMTIAAPLFQLFDVHSSLANYYKRFCPSLLMMRASQE